jgi:hypothetical protein
LQEILCKAAADLFASYGATLEMRDAAVGRPFDVAVVIGFASPQMVGRLALGFDLDAVKAAMPPYISKWQDWAGELGNQLLGRVVNQLLRYGVQAQMATPTVIPMALLSSDGPAWSDCRASVAGFPVGVWLDCESIGDFVPCFTEIELSNEGDTILF